MARKKVKIKEIERQTKNKEIVLGARKVIKLIKTKKLKRTIVASDLEKNIKEEIKDLSNMFAIECEEIKKTRKEIAEELKKPFSIGCVGILG